MEVSLQHGDECPALHCLFDTHKETLTVLITRNKNCDCEVLDVNCGDHFEIDAYTKLSCCTPKTIAMLCVIYIPIKLGGKED